LFSINAPGRELINNTRQGVALGVVPTTISSESGPRAMLAGGGSSRWPLPGGERSSLCWARRAFFPNRVPSQPGQRSCRWRKDRNLARARVWRSKHSALRQLHPHTFLRSRSSQPQGAPPRTVRNLHQQRQSNNRLRLDLVQIDAIIVRLVGGHKTVQTERVG